MPGQQPPDQNALFYDFCLENYVPYDHLLPQIDLFLDLSDLRAHLLPITTIPSVPQRTRGDDPHADRGLLQWDPLGTAFV